MAIVEREAQRLTMPEPPPVAAEPRSRLAGIVSTPMLLVLNGIVVAVCAAVAVASSAADQWRPLGLIAVLAAYLLLAEFGGVALPGNMEGSVSALGMALGITFLHPAPAAAVTVVPLVLDSIHRRVPVLGLASNLALYLLNAVGGALVVGALFGGHPPDVSPATLLCVAAALVLVADHFSFVWVALLGAVTRGASMRRALRRTLLPLTPFHLVSAAFTGAAAVVYVSAGLGALALLLMRLIGSARLVRVITVAENPTLVASMARELVTNAVKHAGRDRDLRHVAVSRAGYFGDPIRQTLLFEIPSVRGAGTVSVVELHGHR